MKNLVKLLVATFFTHGLIVSTYAQTQIPPRWPDLSLTKRDYQGNIQITDRTYLQNAIPQYPAVEFPASPPVRGVAYKRGNDIVIDFQFTYYSDYHLVGDLTFTAARLKSPGPNTNIGTKKFPIWTNPDEYRSMSITGGPFHADLTQGSVLSGTVTIQNVPNIVCVGDIEVKYDFPLIHPENGQSGNNGTWTGYEAWERLFVVDSDPTGLQTIPWADFLEFNCRWAFGAVGEADTYLKMTRGMHYSSRSAQHRLLYEPQANSIYDAWLSPPRIYNLGRLTYQLETSPWTTPDCRAFNSGLALALQSQGWYTNSIYLDAYEPNEGPQPEDQRGFNYWPLCRAGLDSSILSNYAPGSFNYHVIAFKASNPLTYDSAASYKFDMGGAIYMNPPVAWTMSNHYHNNSSGYGLISGTFPTSSGPYYPWLWPSLVDFTPTGLNPSNSGQ